VCCKDRTTLPDAGFPSSILSFFLCSALKPTRKPLVQQTCEQNRPLRACRRSEQNHPLFVCQRFHFLAPRHAQGPKQPHSVQGRDSIQRLLALSNQGRCCFGSLKRFQNRLGRVKTEYNAKPLFYGMQT